MLKNINVLTLLRRLKGYTAQIMVALLVLQTSLIYQVLVAPTAYAYDDGGRVVINEILANPNRKQQKSEQVELYNATDQEVDLSSWKVSELTHRGEEKFYSITADTANKSNVRSLSGTTQIAPGGYLVVVFDGNKLNNNGDRVTLYNADDSVVDSVAYGNAQGAVVEATSKSKTMARIHDAANCWGTNLEPSLDENNNYDDSQCGSVGGEEEEVIDGDKDGVLVLDTDDHCSDVAHVDQEDLDNDGVGDVCNGDVCDGDVCDGDRDGDSVNNDNNTFSDDVDESQNSDEGGIDDNADNCSDVAHVDQEDLDNDDNHCDNVSSKDEGVVDSDEDDEDEGNNNDEEETDEGPVKVILSPDNRSVDLIKTHGISLTVGDDTIEEATFTIENLGNDLPAGDRPRGIRFLNSFFDISVDNDSVFPVELRFYYTQEDLEDAGLIETQLLGGYYFDADTGEWLPYQDTGVNTQDVEVNGVVYVGYIWVMAEHFTPVSFAGDNEAPVKPGNVVAESGDAKVTLTWDSVEDASGYIVRYREATNKDASTAYTEVFVSGGNVTEYVVKGLSNEVLYEFGVAAIDVVNNQSGFVVVVQTPTESKPLDDGLVLPEPKDEEQEAVGGSNIPVVNSQDAIGGSVNPVYDLGDDGVSSEKLSNNDSTVVVNNTIDDQEAAVDGDGEIKGGHDEKKGGSRALVTFLIIISAAAAGFGGYYGYQWWIERPETAPQIKVSTKQKTPKLKAKPRDRFHEDGRW